jgi:hypothetical protein
VRRNVQRGRCCWRIGTTYYIFVALDDNEHPGTVHRTRRLDCAVVS